jgi:hypothetical protein
MHDFSKKIPDGIKNCPGGRIWFFACVSHFWALTSAERPQHAEEEQSTKTQHACCCISAVDRLEDNGTTLFGRNVSKFFIITFFRVLEETQESAIYKTERWVRKSMIDHLPKRQPTWPLLEHIEAVLAITRLWLTTFQLTTCMSGSIRQSHGPRAAETLIPAQRLA